MYTQARSGAAHNRSHGESKDESEAAPSRVRGRFWFACAVLVPANLVWTVWIISVNPGGPWFDQCPLLANVVVFLLALAGLNALFRRFRPAWVLSQTELVLLYTILAVSTAGGGGSYGQNLSIVIAYPHWFGGAGAFSELGMPTVKDYTDFVRFLPSGLTVWDRDVLRGYWTGNSTFYTAAVLRAWVSPLLAWTGFVTMLFFVTMCINVLLRRRWVESERLTFPIVWLPMEMTRPSGVLFRSRSLWGGFALAFAPQFLNGLQHYYSWLPVIQTKYQVIQQSLFPDPPWNAMSPLTIAFHPLMIGLGYLLPMDLLFSTWFFHFFWQAERVLAAVIGFTPDEQGTGFPHIVDQAAGGFLALGVLALWGARRHLQAAWRRAFGRQSTADDAAEAFSYRAAFLGMGLCVPALIAFLVASGMSLITAGWWLPMLLVSMLALTRIRAEQGGPLHAMGGSMNPAESVIRVAGSRLFSPRDLTAFSLNQWYAGSQPMPYGMEALKMAAESRNSQRRVVIAAMVAILVGMVGGVAIQMHHAYTLGASAQLNLHTWGCVGTWDRAHDQIASGTDANLGSLAGVIFGAVTVIFLVAMRVRHAGWPFHPVAYIISSEHGTAVGFFWLPFLIAWVTKSFILRYRGLQGFRAALPFFYGLIIGEMTGGMLWPVYGMITHQSCYSFFGW